MDTKQHAQTPPKRRVGVLGATGTVGQRFLLLLHDHPYFTLHALGASARSAGRPYGQAVNWKLSTPCPAEIEIMLVETCPMNAKELMNVDVERQARLKDCEIVFSGLDSSVATEIESAFASAGIMVFSNAMNFRMHPAFPIIVPSANALHLDILPAPQDSSGCSKFIVTNANCSTVGMVVVLRALQNTFGPIDRVMVTTMQAVSGAGYPGLPVLDIFDNVVPYIGKEEEKIESEPLKILGNLVTEGASKHFQPVRTMRISASVNRVPVLDGHTLTMSISFFNRPAPTSAQARHAMRSYVPEGQAMQCPSAPSEAIHVFGPSDVDIDSNSTTNDDKWQDIHRDRPQPRLDRNRGKGMTVSVGRVRECIVLDLKMVILSHNTMLGAAGGAVWTAELAVLNKQVSNYIENRVK